MSRWIIFCAMAGLSACATPSPLVPGDPEARRAAAVSTRWIAMTRAAGHQCPAAADWTVSPLFPLQEVSAELNRTARNAQLDRFCVYEYQGAEPRPELPREVLDQLAAAAPDKVALTASAVPNLDAVTRDPFQQRFLDQVQIPAALPPAAAPPRVRLAFLDTQATADGVPEAGAPRRSEHGHTLIQIAGHLASGPSRGMARRPIPVEIASRLAMPLVRFDPVRGRELERDEDRGGARGTFADLSAALWEEIVARDHRPEPRRLVLNLSLGWDGEKFGGWESRPDEMPPEVRAVHQVLEVAACEGILVIAAAGNERPGPGATEQPLLPAGWESRGPVKGPGCRPQPLAYAVSGVDGRDQPLVNTRARGKAPRVAYADHVVVPHLHQPGQPTATLTGTSVAAAVVSTTAALVWQYRPGLNAAQVMEILSQSGKTLSRRPDFASPAGGAPKAVRRIGLCPALLKAGALSASRCPLPPPPPPLKQELSLLRPDRRIQRSPSPSAALSIPPSVQDQALIGPQPGENPCPNCAVTEPPDQIGSILEQPSFQGTAAFAKASYNAVPSAKKGGGGGGYRLWIEIPAVWPDGLLKEATLEVFVIHPVTGRKQLLSHCPIHPLGSPGETLEVTRCFDEVKPGTPFQASLSFVLEPAGGGPSSSIVSPLFVEY